MDREAALEEIIGEYQDERQVEAARLEDYRLRRAKLELAREVLVDQGALEEAERLKLEIHNLDHLIEASERTLAQLDHLLQVFQSSLEKLRGSSRSSS